MLFIKPWTFLFFVIYAICGATDFFDGYIARKKKITSSLGATLDSIADLVFITIMLFIFLPILNIPHWLVVWIGIISLVRFSSLFIGFIKYKTPSFLHTYANKITGILLFCFPLLYILIGMDSTCFLLCLVASISAIEELAINISSTVLMKDIKCILRK